MTKIVLRIESLAPPDKNKRLFFLFSDSNKSSNFTRTNDFRIGLTPWEFSFVNIIFFNIGHHTRDVMAAAVEPWAVVEVFADIRADNIEK